MARDTVEFVTRLYSREDYVAEVTVSPQTEDTKMRDLFEKEIRVTAFSQQSERCLPLQVLHTIGSAGVYFKLRGSNQQLHGDIQNLSRFYGSCLNDAKTAVVILEGGNEVHLVAMSSGSELQVPCFWAYLVGQGLYASCLQMFNMRCLSIVFDLDETLIVANTQRSFELKMDTLKYRTPSTAESVAELKRYQDDRAILKQYIESDTVFVNGRAIRAQNEVVPPVSEGALPIMRPIIRVPERNMILTRINPAIRDTSVLVKLRPAWDDLRSYVIAKGRKRFEVYICTMSERDYALEMWRLLDPEGQLINVKELNDRVVCVESGGKKSLANVFARQTCHPKMAMVIDDRMKVWDEKDQARVHVVTPFAPYGAPQAEMVAGAVPVLYVARNVACSVRGGFFRDFDDSLHLQMTTVRYDTDLASLPSPPDVSNYLDSQEAFAPGFGSNVVSKDLADGIASSEVESRIPQEIPAAMESRIQPAESEDLRLTLRPPVQPTQLFATSVLKEPAIVDSQKEDCHTYLNVSTTRPLSVGLPPLPDISKASSPAREEGEVPESELDPDTRRRLLILQHGQDTGQAHAPLEKVEDSTFPPLQVNLPSISSGGWLGAEEEMSPRQLSRNSPLILEPESPSFDRMNQVHFQLPAEGSFSGERDFRLSRRRYADEGFLEDQHRTDQSLLEDSTSPGNGTHVRSDAVTVLQGIGEKCKHVVEYRILPNASQVSVEVMFGGEKIGEGVGRTKQEAKLKAAEHALRCLAGTPPMSSGNSSSVPSSMYSGTSDGRVQRRGPRDSRMVGAGLDMPIASTSGQINYMDYRPLDEPVAARTQYDAVLALTELCQAEGLSLTFSRRGFQCHVEVGGKLLGKGSGPSWESARQQGAEDTLRNLQPQHTSGLHKRTNAPRSPPLHSNKRPRVGEFLRGASPLRHLPGSPHRGRHRLSPNKRYSKSGLPI